jgi:DNA polymerase-1
MPTQELVRLFQRHYPFDESDVVIHGLKAWLKFFSDRRRISFDSPRFRCARLLAYLLDPPEKAEEESDRDLSLQSLVSRYLGTPYPLWGIWLRETSYPEALYQRLWEDAQYTYQLWNKLMDQVDSVDDAEFLHLYYDIELPMVRILLDMELRGIRVDRDQAARRVGAAKKELESLQDRITALVGTWTNPNSHREVRKFFFELQGEPLTGPIRDQVFIDLAGRHPAVGPMLEYRKLSRDLNFLERASQAEDGRLYPKYHQCRIATGRVSVTDPPLQSIKKEYREGLLLPEPGHLLVEADYRQAEARILAYFCRDERLCAILEDDSKDVFEETARALSVRVSGLGRVLTRQEGKLLFYSITYGASGESIGAALSIEAEAAEHLAYLFRHEIYPQIGDFIHRLREHLLSLGRRGRYLETPWGRRRMFDRRLISLHEKDQPMMPKEPTRDPEVRRAFNFLLQGTVADLIKQVQVRLDEFFRENEMESRTILNIHDGLYLSLPPSEYPVVEQVVRETMESPDLIERIRTYAHVSPIFPIDVPLKARIRVIGVPVQEDLNQTDFA